MKSYKSFGRLLRNFPLVPSLVDCWQYSLHIVERQSLPPDYAVGRPIAVTTPLHEHLYPWELDILIREMVLNASDYGLRSLRQWDDLAGALNQIRRLDDEASSIACTASDVMLELHRRAHQQFPWQIGGGAALLMRVAKIYGADAVEKVVQSQFGMSAQGLVRLGMAVAGNFHRQWGMSLAQDYSFMGVSRDASSALLKRITCDLDSLKDRTKRLQRYDADWSYTWNPLQATPLIRFDRDHPDHVMCPMPRWVLHRLTSGVFHDLVGDASFSNPFGRSFQAYVGKVLEATCPSRMTVMGEKRYRVGQARKDGIDWTLGDDTGHLFIECKSKRLTMDAKTRLDPAALDRDLRTMAQAVTQHYKNIQDTLEGHTRWTPDRRPCFALILTLEDWFLSNPRLEEMLDSHVTAMFEEAGLSITLLDQVPYAIASVQEFEAAIQVAGRVGIGTVFGTKTQEEYRRWSLLPFMFTVFKAEMGTVDWHLFREDWASIIPQSPIAA